ncbi:hypothetical protein V9W64_10940 [Neisseria leonii]|uniref:Uncharacterized protein n=1 Tax=Neisseria leonii TaxID=2995413 RepID=A0A9X4ID51_9NEIS|nr:hypothetical protein [Neisseria sp. 51.81]MDD9326758.1 hypothetical protein [Neisseria sp. 51.81]
MTNEVGRIPRHDLQLYRGDTEVFVFRITQGGQPVAMAAEDLDCMVEAAGYPPLRPQILTDGAGEIRLVFAPEATQGLLWQSGEYDLQFAKDGVVRTLVRGKVTLEKDITR